MKTVYVVSYLDKRSPYQASSLPTLPLIPTSTLEQLAWTLSPPLPLFLVAKPLASHSTTSSSLNSLMQRHKLGAELYRSDPSLAAQRPNLPEELQQKAKDLAESKRQVPLLSRESLMAQSLSNGVISGLELRGSGTFLLDQNVQSRPRSLPPLNVNSRNTSILHNPSSSGRRGLCEKEAGLKTFFPSAPRGASKELTRTFLLRRHSMQTEQFKTTIT